jgi:Lon protease-like protein
MEIPLFPLNTVLFPGATLPLLLFEPRYKLMLARCQEDDLPFGVVLIRAGREVGGGAEPFDVGTTARFIQVQERPDGAINVVSAGIRRFRIEEQLHDQPYLRGRVEFLEDEDEDAPEIPEAVRRTGELFSEYTKLGFALTDQWTRRVALPSRPGALADYVAARMEIESRTKQRLLEELSVPRRLATEQRLLENANVLLASQLQAARRQKFAELGFLN